MAKERREVGEARGSEAGEQAKGEVEEANQNAGRQAKWAGGWDAEVGDDPQGARREAGADGGDEAREISGGEAIEEEVGGDEVEGRVCGGAALR